MKIEQGTCPKCGGENLDYGTVELYDDQCYFPRTCKKCGARGEEWYTLYFDGHYNVIDKDGNDINLPDNQKENDSEGTNRRT